MNGYQKYSFILLFFLVIISTALGFSLRHITSIFKNLEENVKKEVDACKNFLKKKERGIFSALYSEEKGEGGFHDCFIKIFEFGKGVGFALPIISIIIAFLSFVTS